MMKRFYTFFKIFIFFINYKLITCQLLTRFNIPELKFQQQFDQTQIIKYKKNLGERLILTSLIESGQLTLARKFAKVNEDLFLNVTSYSGYLTVDNIYNGNLFFWFFPAEGTEHLFDEYDVDDYDGEDEYTDYDHDYLKKLVKRPNKQHDDQTKNLNNHINKKPIVLWLQGGPGVSSLYGLFTENGPFCINDDLRSIRENPHSWHKNFSVLYVDNPVGTGFSFTDTKDGYVKNMKEVGVHMYIALRQFFELFPFIKKNNFFITGESYAGKYIPAIANEIYEQNIINQYDEDKIINLKGIAMGNAFSDPHNMNEYAEFAYQIGLVGELGYQEMKINEYLLRSNFDNPIKAKVYWDGILQSFVKNSHYSNLYNIAEPDDMDLFIFFDFINQPKIRNAIHVGPQQFQDPSIVYAKLIPDFMNTSMHWVEKLLNAGLRVFYYSGNWDFIVAYPLSENSFKKMKWNDAELYRYRTPRKPFLINGKLKGYIKKTNNFAEGTFLNAGHMVPADQPEACIIILSSFFEDKL